jgi:hypothetical protein
MMRTAYGREDSFAKCASRNAPLCACDIFHVTDRTF